MVKDYLDKFATLNVRNEMKHGFKIFEISWYGDFKKKDDMLRVKKNLKGVTASINGKQLTIKLKVDENKSVMRYFYKMSKNIQTIIEKNGGMYVGYDFGLEK